MEPRLEENEEKKMEKKVIELDHEIEDDNNSEPDSHMTNDSAGLKFEELKKSFTLKVKMNKEFFIFSN